MTLTAKTVGVFFLVLVFLLGCIIAGMWVFVMQSVLDNAISKPLPVHEITPVLQMWQHGVLPYAETTDGG